MPYKKEVDGVRVDGVGVSLALCLIEESISPGQRGSNEVQVKPAEPPPVSSQKYEPYTSTATSKRWMSRNNSDPIVL